MVALKELTAYCNEYLSIEAFSDYCPNGLQVEAGKDIGCLVSGVSASQALIDAAVEKQADAILVHHGYFWKGEDPCLTGIKGRRVRALIENGINLLAYHLPLDMHPEVGNNAQLAKVLGLTEVTQADACSDIWLGRLREPAPAESFASMIKENLGREPLHIGSDSDIIRSVGWCTGAAQDYLAQAAEAGVDAYISGEISERTVLLARESGVHYFAAGHHATERYGVQALGEMLADKFDINHHFIDIPNPV